MLQVGRRVAGKVKVRMRDRDRDSDTVSYRVCSKQGSVDQNTFKRSEMKLLILDQADY